MNYVDMVNDAIDYLESNLEHEIRLDEMAKRYYLSPMHFYRIFRAVVGRSVKAYTEARRLSKALEELRTTDRKIIDIAFRYGYGSHETFSRSFLRFFGVSPTQARQSSGALPVYDRPRLVERDFKNINKDVVVTFTRKRLPALRLVGREMAIDPESLADLNRVDQFINGFVAEWIVPTKQSRLYNVTRNNVTFPDENIAYFTGFAPAGEPDFRELITLEIPASSYAVFQYKHGMGSVFATAINDVYTAISVSGLRLNAIGIDFMEVYEHDYAATGTFSIYVPIDELL